MNELKYFLKKHFVQNKLLDFSLIYALLDCGFLEMISFFSFFRENKYLLHDYKEKKILGKIRLECIDVKWQSWHQLS